VAKLGRGWTGLAACQPSLSGYPESSMSVMLYKILNHALSSLMPDVFGKLEARVDGRSGAIESNRSLPLQLGDGIYDNVQDP
jgi:hypothetical protein